MRKSTIPALAALAVMTSAIALPAHAETPWQAHHPLRTEDNARLNNQNRRIRNEVRTGQITPRQGAALHATDHAIREEERGMSSVNGTHLTSADQRAITQQENAQSRAIGR